MPRGECGEMKKEGKEDESVDVKGKGRKATERERGKVA